VSNSIVH